MPLNIKAGDKMASIINAVDMSNNFNLLDNSINYTSNSVTNIQKKFRMFKLEINKGVDTKSFDIMAKKIDTVADKMSTVLDRFTEIKPQSTININMGNIEAAAAKAKTLGDRFRESVAGVNDLAEKAKGIATSVWPAVKAGMAMSDSYARQNSQLEAINDGNQSQAALQNKVFAAAQNSRTSYAKTAETVTKLGSMDNFKTNDEAIYFTEVLNKAFSGMDASSAANSIDQITQAMVSGNLEGKDFASLMEKAPALAQSISQYTGKSPELLAQDGVSADVMKNSVYSGADSINQAFANTPVTFEQIGIKLKNSMSQALGPILEKISEITKNQDFQTMINGICGAFFFLRDVVLGVFDVISNIAGFIIDNWSFVGPVIFGIIAAIVILNVVTLIYTAVQWALNSALFACPLVWIILLIIALIVIVYLVVAAINKFAGTSISATGVIAGYFSMVGTTIYNVFAMIWNHIASFVEFFANVFTNPVYSIKRLFVNVFTNILDFIKTIASAIDMIFHTNLAGNITSLKNQMNGWLGEMPEGYKVIKRMEMKNLDTAYSEGYKWGENLESSFKLPDIMGGVNKVFAPDKYKEPQDIKNNIADTAANTGSMKNSMDVSEEDLKYMRDIAEQEVINRFTTAEIKVDMTNNNNINSNLDLDGVVAHMEKKVYETLTVAAEGVYI